MVAFYKHHIPAWMDGTGGLSDGAYRVYHVVCQLIYQNEGRVALNERVLAGICNQSVRAFRKHFEELVQADKLMVEDGKIWNSRAEKELEAVNLNRENARRGGERSAKARENPGTDRENPGTDREIPGTDREKSETKPENSGKLVESSKNGNDFNEGDQAPLDASMKPKRLDETRLEERRLDNTRLDRAHARTRDGPPDGGAGVFSQWDFLSDDGEVIITALEFKQAEEDCPNLKNIRGLVRNAYRNWAHKLPRHERKSAIMLWLSKRDQEAISRQDKIAAEMNYKISKDREKEKPKPIRRVTP